MKRFTVIIAVFFVLILISVGLYFIFREKKNPDELILYGNVDVRQVDIGFRVAGSVGELCYEEGDFVPEGCLMAVLDKSPYDSQISQSQANLESIKASLENAEILLRRRQQAVRYWRRLERRCR